MNSVTRMNTFETDANPTPTRFLMMECGLEGFTPGLSLMGDLNPFEASFKSDKLYDNNNKLSMRKDSAISVQSDKSEWRADSPESVDQDLQQDSAPVPDLSHESSVSPPSSPTPQEPYKFSSAAGQKRKSEDEEDDTEEKRRKFLERNRMAASKCRQKKKMWMQQLESRADEITTRNKSLHVIVSQLKEEVMTLKNQLLAHRNCNCNVIQQYVQTSGQFAFNSAPRMPTLPPVMRSIPPIMPTIIQTIPSNMAMYAK